MMPIANYTTSVEAARTAAEVQQMLVRHGAREINLQFDARGNVVGLKWLVELPQGWIPFKLPLHVDGVYRALCREAPPRFHTREQAYRVAWRVLKDWVRAQMALIEAGQVDFAEVFLPYVLGRDDKSLYEHMLAGGFQQFALPEGEGGEHDG